MPLINIGNRNANPTPAVSPNDATAPIPTNVTLAPLPNKELPRAQEIPVTPVQVPQALIEIKPTPTQQIVNQKQEFNNLSNAINNLASTMPKPVVSAQTPVGDIANQVKQAVAPTDQIEVKPIVTETSRPVQSTLPVLQAPKDPANNLDEKLNRLNNLNSIQPTVSPAPAAALPSVETAGLTNKSYKLDDFLQEAMKQGASDVHISVGYRVMIRVNGELKTIESPLVTPEFAVDYVKQLLKGRTVKIEEIFEYDMTYTLDARRFRINIFKENSTFAIAARVISETIPTVEQLDLPPLMKEFSKYPNGLVLVTGPTGSGKSTTIASVINLINLTDAKHIITLEDPVEYIFPKGLSIVDQREFGQDFSSWSNALRAILRQDPNIVLVGEMRDLETVEAALRIAETGHLVFATLHTNSASQTIDRIIDMFPAEKQEQVKVQLASVIQAVISQRLVKTLNNSRVAAMEILIATSAVKNTIRESKGIQLDNIIQTGADLGMISMEKSLVKLVKEGKVSSDVAKVIANRPADFDILLQRN
ncbi:MAG: type IV pilus twitching motility protein PilT [Candidatus Dojkabacteria bacterium]